MQHSLPARRTLVPAKLPSERDTSGNRTGIAEDRLQFLNARILKRNLGADRALRRERAFVEADLRIEIDLRRALLKLSVLRCYGILRDLDIRRQPIPSHVVERRMANSSRGQLEAGEFHSPGQHGLMQVSPQPSRKVPLACQTQRNLRTAKAAKHRLPLGQIPSVNV